MSATPRIVAIIPARGGSKGIPRKNLAPLGGRPLLAWSIDAAREAREVDAVVVSTDNAEIAACARSYGAHVIDRPAVLSGDSCSSESALLHALDTLEACGKPADIVVFLQATSPFRRPGRVSEALAHFFTTGADSLLAVAPSHVFLWREGPHGAEALNYDPAHRPRRQDMPPQYRETGSLYITRSALLRASGNRLNGKIVLFKMSKEEDLDIDTPADLAYARWRLEQESRT